MKIQEKTSKVIYTHCNKEKKEKNNVKTLILSELSELSENIDVKPLNTILKNHKKEKYLILVFTVELISNIENNIPNCADLTIGKNQKIIACIDVTKLKSINDKKIENSKKMNGLLEICKTIEEEKNYEHAGIYAKPYFLEKKLKIIKYDKGTKTYKPNKNSDEITKDGHTICIEEMNSNLEEKPKFNENKSRKILNSIKNFSSYINILMSAISLCKKIFSFYYYIHSQPNSFKIFSNICFLANNLFTIFFIFLLTISHYKIMISHNGIFTNKWKFIVFKKTKHIKQGSQV